jgi:hypothetical protein
MPAGRRSRRPVTLVLALVLASCGAGADEAIPGPDSQTSAPTSAPLTIEQELPEALATINAGGEAFNEGDRAAFVDLWANSALVPGGLTFDDPAFQWILEVAMDGLHEQVIDSECHLTEPGVVYCDELHVDDLIRPAGVGWRTSRVYEVASRQIVSFTEVSSNRRTTNAFLSSFMEWLATEDPVLFERAFDLDAEVVWRSIEAIHETVALVEVFVSESPDYPLVPPERLENPELTGAVAGEPGTEIEVFNGETHQIEVVEWGVQRYRLAGLSIPSVASITFPPHELCARNSGWAIDDGEEQRIVLCIFENEMCEDEGCETLSALARATLVHEMAHVWTIGNLDASTRERFLDLRQVEVWQGPGLLWAEQGSEHAAEIIMWGVMEETLDLFRLGIPSCADLEEAYQLLTGRPSLRGDC